MRARFYSTRADQLARLRAAGWQIITMKAAPVVVAFQSIGEKYHVKAWKGAADKAAFYYCFRSEDRARAYVDEYTASVARGVTSRAERTKATADKRASLKASDHFTVGDVVYNSWGYDQTNIDWYQVVEVKAKSVVIRPVARNYAETQFMAGRCQPRRNEFTGEAQLKPLDETGNISAKHGGFSKWDGRAVYESHYA